ncbi:DDB1- and CUL4-associated factor 6-like [Liolophura sinensis]|uniref:DDB1- and CUL4-associated factor 6-like n=1 Tax=Liolophura sinensis TaxID=3198878 RepID=UPI00315837E3
MFRALYDKQYGRTEPAKLFSLAKANVSFVQRLILYRNLDVHSGCVNTICWSDSGSSILSGADDQQLVITCPYTGQKQLSIRSGHRANIFSAKFLPNTVDKQIVSCSGDGKIYFTEVEREDTYGTQCFDCHYGTTYEVITIPGEASTFLSCGEDGTVRWFDLRIKTKCQKEDCKEDVMINCSRAVTSLSVNPILPYQLGVACSDSAVRIFDRRMLGTRLMGNYSGRMITGLVSRFSANLSQKRFYRITSLQYSPDGKDMLVSYSSELLYLFSTKEDSKSQEFQKTSKPEVGQSIEDICTKGNDSGSDSGNTKTDKPTDSSKVEKDTSSAHKSDSQEATTEVVETRAAEDNLPQSSSQEGAVGSNDTNPRQPPIKRLRLRGDWSDTGPNARPESERDDVEERSPHVTLMQRMSDMLTRWLDGNIRPEQGEAGSTSAAGEGSSNPEGGDEPQGAEGRSDMPTGRRRGVQEHQGLIQDLESMEIPRQPHCDITDTLRSLSKYHQPDGSSQLPVKKSCNNPESFKLSTSPCPEDMAETDQQSSVTDFQISQHAPESCGNGASLPKGEPSSSCDRSVSGALNNEDVKSTHQQQHPSKDTGLGSSESGHVTSDSALATGSRPLRKGQDWIEPVISLNYSTEGTTSSTIQVEFTSFPPEDKGPSLSQTSSAVHANRTDEPSGLASKQESVIESHSTSGNVLGSNRLIRTKNDSGSVDTCGSLTATGDSCSSETATVDSSSAAAFDSSEMSTVNSSSETAAFDTSEMSTVNSSSETAAVHSSKVGAHDSSGMSSVDSLTADEESLESAAVDSSAEAMGDEHLMHSVEVIKAGVSSRHPDGNTQTADCEQGAMTKQSDAVSSRLTSQGDVMKAQDQSTTDQGRQPRWQDTVESTSSQVGSGTRQRRIGRSGPPTGDFQLDSRGDSSDEGPGEASAQRRQPQRDDSDDLERNVAAIRLQNFYRKKHAEREEKDLDAIQVYQPKVKRKYRGHRNARTMIKEANFWGDGFVMSGSDCGHIFMWDRNTTELVMLLEADRHVVNCLQPHPFDPVLASSGIDYDIKVWAPLSSTQYFDQTSAAEIIRRNEVMLEETRDTITVPAAFMLRVLASLNHIRTGRPSENESASDSD